MWGALTGSASRARSEALSVYRALLRGAKAFPSVKRQAIYEEIRCAPLAIRSPRPRPNPQRPR